MNHFEVKLSYFTRSFLVMRFFRVMQKKFCLMTLIVTFDLHIKNFNLGYNFWTVRDRDLILACILNKWNPFKSLQSQWPCDLDCDL